MDPLRPFLTFFFFNDTATTEIYTLSLHDALPIYACRHAVRHDMALRVLVVAHLHQRSEEHTSELQSHLNLVCRLLLEKKKKICNQAAQSPPRPLSQPHAGCSRLSPALTLAVLTLF